MVPHCSAATEAAMAEPCGAEILVRNLKAQGVTRVFGVPGAKIDRVYDALLDSRIETVVCRHEQNASFIAQGLGRMTGKAGVCLVTSGLGTTKSGDRLRHCDLGGFPGGWLRRRGGAGGPAEA